MGPIRTYPYGLGHIGPSHMRPILACYLCPTWVYHGQPIWACPYGTHMGVPISANPYISHTGSIWACNLCPTCVIYGYSHMYVPIRTCVHYGQPILDCPYVIHMGPIKACPYRQTGIHPILGLNRLTIWAHKGHLWACPYVLDRMEPIWVFYGRPHMDNSYASHT